MCDTVVALANSTYDESVIFGKNSDREPNEAHEVIIIPPATHPSGDMVKCTYVDIPQVRETCQVLLAKPFWIWGAEMGSNEFGVTIGNEAVFTKTPYNKQAGLIGMDFLRLALERSDTAEAALEVIVKLLEEYGQGGNCGCAHPFYYHNSYLICDREEAWVLETSGKEWAAEKVHDVRSISNAITIGKKWDRASSTLVSNAVKNGWCQSEEDFNFARCYSEPIYTRFSDAQRRQSFTTQKLNEAKRGITPKMVMELLRAHGGDSDPHWAPDKGITGADVCMHAGWGPIRTSQTVGSMVSVLRKGEKPVHWVTGTAAPCTSIFKPVWLDSGLPEQGASPTNKYDRTTLYWRHEALHREILRDYNLRIRLLRPDQERIENDLINEVENSRAASPETRRAVTNSAFEQVEQAEEKWRENIISQPVSRANSFLYQMAWNRFNRDAGMS